ncbi:major facilitator superfamily domain-containing protein [Thelonectria olida]|uniref:Major facilitator superfamily domain-containing protein n=1 Tax=Thelonectria olida TaxID=1576542 RepID=A0A9P9AI71_9HYPO|nr:major facilitator superfamily domain-containing protein [Thelonectria olida]
MAGGVKKPVNVFKLKDLGEPEGVFNWRLWFSVISFSLLSAARGIYEGLISSAFNSTDFKETIHYDSYSTGAGQHQGQCICYGADRVGWRRPFVSLSLICEGLSILTACNAFLICDRIGRIWATRFLCFVWAAGIAVFMAGGVNGNLGATYAGRFIAGLSIGQTPVVGPVYIAKVAPASIRGLCTYFFTRAVYIGVVLAYFTNYGCALAPTSLHIYELPCFRVKQGKPDQAAQMMACIRKQPVDGEYVVALEYALEAIKGVGWLGKLIEMCLMPRNLYRLYLASMGDFLFYLFRIIGTNELLFITAVFRIVKLVAALIYALFLISIIGRKKALLTGITLQAISIIYVASFLIDEDFVLLNSNKGASRGAFAIIYISRFSWALGWNLMQYLLTAELFPLRICILETSWYSNSCAVPNMLLSASNGGISLKGTFWCFAAVTFIGGLWAWFSIPETSGCSLESIDHLFDLP